MASKQEHISSKLSFEKLKELDAYFDEQLKGNKKKDTKAARWPHGISAKKITGTIFGVICLLMLPFLVLIRGSLYVYQQYAINSWLSLATGVALTILLLLVYAAIVNYSISQTARVHKYIRNGIIFLVVAYCIYGLIYFSGVNAKSDEVASYYRSLHPILRVTMATTILLHGDLIVTDMQRSPDDYRAMGLPVREHSLHYPQQNGYVHAVDIRTVGRPEWKNRLAKITFGALGMNTLRHTGTADHLHVSLPAANK